MSRAPVLLGGGGHARVLADALLAGGRPPAGYVAPRNAGELLPGIPWLGDDDWLQRQPPDTPLVDGLGSAPDTGPRRALWERFRALGFRFVTVVHPAATVAASATLGEGCQVLAGAVVNAGAELGANSIVNSRAVVEHDCRLAAHCHVASGAVLCGAVTLEECVHVGAGATVLQGLRIGTGAIVAAGATVIDDVESLTLVAGVPARVKRRIQAR